MPEGDTVFVAATRLSRALAGARIERSDFRVPRFATVDLSGRTLREIEARGKHLLFRFDGGVTLHTHYKMEGSWHLYRRGERWRGPSEQVRAVLETADWVAVGFRLAIVEILATDAEDTVVGHLGPDPLRDDWDPDLVIDAIRSRPEEEIGAILLDQSVLAGPGNVYKSEALFLAGIHPWTAVSDVSELRRVVDLIARLMRANKTTGGQVTTGDPRPGRSRWVYGRGGEKCFRCGDTVRRAEQPGYGGERVTYWCPTCQPVEPPPVQPVGPLRKVYRDAHDR